jgi:hypothetical protein
MGLFGGASGRRLRVEAWNWHGCVFCIRCCHHPRLDGERSILGLRQEWLRRVAAIRGPDPWASSSMTSRSTTTSGAGTRPSAGPLLIHRGDRWQRRPLSQDPPREPSSDDSSPTREIRPSGRRRDVRPAPWASNRGKWEYTVSEGGMSLEQGDSGFRANGALHLS